MIIYVVIVLKDLNGEFYVDNIRVIRDAQYALERFSQCAVWMRMAEYQEVDCPSHIDLSNGLIYENALVALHDAFRDQFSSSILVFYVNRIVGNSAGWALLSIDTVAIEAETDNATILTHELTHISADADYHNLVNPYMVLYDNLWVPGNPDPWNYFSRFTESEQNQIQAFN